ncbi:MAG: hypothetical protein IPL65_10050 [Lewinellaceae bacterium]|nr:hypothetical protein [Lewinellaceae bacterium]
MAVYPFNADKALSLFVYSDNAFGVFEGAQDFFRMGKGFWIPLVQLVILTGISWAGFRSVEKELPPDRLNRMPLLRRVVLVLTLTLPAYAFLQIMTISSGVLVWLMGILFFPLATLWAATLYFEMPNPILAAARSFITFRFSQTSLLGFFYVSLGMMFFLFLYSPPGPPSWDSSVGWSPRENSICAFFTVLPPQLPLAPSSISYFC